MDTGSCRDPEARCQWHFFWGGEPSWLNNRQCELCLGSRFSKIAKYTNVRGNWWVQKNGGKTVRVPGNLSSLHLESGCLPVRVVSEANVERWKHSYDYKCHMSPSPSSQVKHTMCQQNLSALAYFRRLGVLSRRRAVSVEFYLYIQLWKKIKRPLQNNFTIYWYVFE